MYFNHVSAIFHKAPLDPFLCICRDWMFGITNAKSDERQQQTRFRWISRSSRRLSEGAAVTSAQKAHN